jgi:hypothetical protein
MDLRELPAATFRRHPWELARADFFVDLVGRHGSNKPIAVLDVGAGDGYLASKLIAVLPPGSRVACCDPNYTDSHIEAFTRAAPTGVAFHRELVESPVDWLLLLDVIEHVLDDVAFLDELVSTKLVPGGTALLSVPAWPALFSRHDELLGHYRRYRPVEFATVVRQSGLVEVDGGSLFSSLLLPRALSKALEPVRNRATPEVSNGAAQAVTDASNWRGGRFSTAALTFALKADAGGARALARFGVKLPGLTLWKRAIKQ